MTQRASKEVTMTLTYYSPDLKATIDNPNNVTEALIYAMESREYQIDLLKDIF